MTVRDGVDQPRRVVPRDQWRFARRDADGSLVDDPTRVYLEGGFEPFKIYDVVYVAQDPALVGLGPAAVRDMVSHMKYEATPALGLPGPAPSSTPSPGASRRAAGSCGRSSTTGSTSTSRTGGRSTASCPTWAGGGRGSFNHRFAQPSRDGHPFLNKLYPSEHLPVH